MFLTYNWNKILCNLSSAYLSKNMKYRSLMSPLSKLNVIEILEAGRGNSEATVHYGLFCSCCNKFIINSDRFTAYCRLLLINIMGHFILSGKNLTTKTTTLHLSQPTPPCVSKCMFLRCFCLDHSKFKVVLQNSSIRLMIDDFENLWKSE